MTSALSMTIRRIRAAMAGVFVAAVVTACGANSDNGLDRVDATQASVTASAHTKMGDPQNWSVAATTSNGDGYVFYGDETYQWLDAACISELRGASVPVSTVGYQEIRDLAQLPGMGDCAVVRAALSSATGGDSGQWQVVTTTNAGDGYVLYGNGTRQWLDAACVIRLRGLSIAINAAEWSAISELAQVPGVGDCNAVAQNAGGGDNGSGDAWQVVTTTLLGDGYVLYPNNTRQWLSASCITQLRAGSTIVREVSWDEIKGMTQIDGVGDCSEVAQNADSGGDSDSGAVCNLLANGDFEVNASGWKKSATITLSSDSYDGDQALSVQSGWISYEIPVVDLSGAIRFTGFFKGVVENSASFVGIDFIDANGDKSGGVSSRLITLVPDGEYVPLSGYTRFVRTAQLPDGTAKVRVWVYTDESVLVDNLDVRGENCINPAPQGATTWTVSCTDFNAGIELGSAELAIDYPNLRFYVNGLLVMKTFEHQRPTRARLFDAQEFIGIRRTVFNDLTRASEGFTTYRIPEREFTDGQLSRSPAYRISGSRVVNGSTQGPRIVCR